MINKYLIVLMLIVPAVFAHSITVKMEYNITPNDDVHINSANKYVSRTGNGVTGALIFAGELFLNVGNYSITQNEHNNRFLFAFTNASYNIVADKIMSVGKMLSDAFSPISMNVPDKLYFILSYFDINIINSGKIGRGFNNIVIKNTAKGRMII